MNTNINTDYFLKNNIKTLTIYLLLPAFLLFISKNFRLISYIKDTYESFNFSFIENVSLLLGIIGCLVSYIALLLSHYKIDKGNLSSKREYLAIIAILCCFIPIIIVYNYGNQNIIYHGYNLMILFVILDLTKELINREINFIDKDKNNRAFKIKNILITLTIYFLISLLIYHSETNIWFLEYLIAFVITNLILLIYKKIKNINISTYSFNKDSFKEESKRKKIIDLMLFFALFINVYTYIFIKAIIVYNKAPILLVILFSIPALIIVYLYCFKYRSIHEEYIKNNKHIVFINMVIKDIKNQNIDPKTMNLIEDLNTYIVHDFNSLMVFKKSLRALHEASNQIYSEEQIIAYFKIKNLLIMKNKKYLEESNLKNENEINIMNALNLITNKDIDFIFNIFNIKKEKFNYKNLCKMNHLNYLKNIKFIKLEENIEKEINDIIENAIKNLKEYKHFDKNN
tara:strand:- start:1406 stop:2776 length:1371 start_codon:yes stop_codon:yes gene_type:complete